MERRMPHLDYQFIADVITLDAADLADGTESHAEVEHPCNLITRRRFARYCKTRRQNERLEACCTLYSGGSRLTKFS
jgi:hypothetical protein